MTSDTFMHIRWLGGSMANVSGSISQVLDKFCYRYGSVNQHCCELVINVA